MEMQNLYENDRSILYPEARRETVTETYHDVIVSDPYRWLETDSSERTEWITAQRELTKKYLPRDEVVEEFQNRIDSYAPETRRTATYAYGNRTFLSELKKGNNYAKTIELLADGSERVIIDPNTWSEDGTVSPAGKATSPNGSYVCVGRSAKGNDRQTWSVINVETNEYLPDTIPSTFNSAISWLDDESGFFYTLLHEDGRRSIQFHAIGTTQNLDKIYFMPEEKDLSYYSKSLATDDSYLFVYKHPASGINSIQMIDLKNEGEPIRQLISDEQEDSETYVLFSKANFHLLVTKDNTPKGRIVAIENGEMTEVIPESNDVLESAEVVLDRIVITYNDGIRSYLVVYDFDGKVIDTITTPDEIGLVSFNSQDSKNPNCYIHFESPIRPTTIYSYNIETNATELYKKPEYAFNPDDYEVSLEYATSEDGTQVPMFVSKSKKVVYDGSNPTILYGYGGFDIKIQPSFDETVIPWLDEGGVYVQACLRGGGEFGSEWHDAGKKLKKQNVFNDFIACAEDLIARKVTSSEKLTIHGGSNGGLLVAAVLLQRPDLFAIVAPSAGLLDMIRYDKDDHGIAGIHWQSEYGTTDNKEEFFNLLGYSPVHTITPNIYPTVYATVGESDDRVLPSNTYKFIAGMQHAQQGSHPILVDVEPKSGHNLSGRNRRLRAAAKRYAFILENLRTSK